MTLPPIYVINFNDESRKQKMICRFKSLDISLRFVPPVFTDDVRLDIPSDTSLDTIPKIDKRIWSIMLQHLDSIRDFYDNTTESHCIVCEDDIFISKYFKRDLPKILKEFDEQKLDVLLLGYLIPYKIDIGETSPLQYIYKSFDDDLWGSQMYLITRNHAKFLLDKYTIDFAINNIDLAFSPDWTLTKMGHRAILCPMLAVEEGTTKTEHWGQNNFHHNCFLANYDPDIYI